jgi:hypothetical protein
LAFDFKVIFNGSFSEIATVYEKAFVRTCILAQDIDNCFLSGQTARLFFVSTADFDIAGERANIDQAKIRLLGLTTSGEKQVEKKREKGEKKC